jgi:hypothetical protein
MSMQVRNPRTDRSPLSGVVALALAAVASAALLIDSVSAAPALRTSSGTQDVVRNYLGHAPADAATALGARAKFVDQNFTPIAAADAQGVIIWQTPLPGQTLAAGRDALFLATIEVPVPVLEGLRVGDAQTLLSYRGLVLDVVGTCSASGRAPTDEEMDWQVVHQCLAPNDVLTVGGHVGVVIQPWPDDGVSLVMALTLAVLAAVACSAALIFFMRLRFAQDELSIYKSGRAPKT